MTVTKLNYFDAAMVRANAAVNIVVLTINCLSDVHCPITHCTERAVGQARGQKGLTLELRVGW